MQAVLDLLVANPLLLLFLVAAIGFPLGRIRIGGAHLGTAMVLFTGIAIGSLDPRLKIPEEIIFLGLALFVYCIGLSSSQGFFAALNREGLKQSFLTVSALFCAFGVALAVAHFAGVKPGLAATMFCGALTNTPALASVLDAAPKDQKSALLVGYALSYPLGVLLPIFLISMSRRIFGVNFTEEAAQIPGYKTLNEKIVVQTAEVCQSAVVGVPLENLTRDFGGGFTFGRVRHGGQLVVAHGQTTLSMGDLVTVVGPSTTVDRVINELGRFSEEHLESDRQEVDYRRIFVSNEAVAGRTLKDLDLPGKFDAVITRMKRGDLDFIPNGDTILQLGDRVRVLAKVQDHPAIARLFGDQYRALTDTDMLALCIGMTLGILLGKIPIPLPSGAKFELGLAGGPLIVAILLGRLQRTGPMVWQIPYSANLSLREFGLTIFAAGVGVKAGYSFKSTLAAGQGLDLLLGGAAATLITGLVVLTLGYWRFKIPLNLLLGTYSGTCTQPIALGFAKQQTKNEIPNTGYATVFPVATIAKIVLAQLLLNFAR